MMEFRFLSHSTPVTAAHSTCSKEICCSKSRSPSSAWRPLSEPWLHHRGTSFCRWCCQTQGQGLAPQLLWRGSLLLEPANTRACNRQRYHSWNATSGSGVMKCFCLNAFRMESAIAMDWELSKKLFQYLLSLSPLQGSTFNRRNKALVHKEYKSREGINSSEDSTGILN